MRKNKGVVNYDSLFDMGGESHGREIWKVESQHLKVIQSDSFIELNIKDGSQSGNSEQVHLYHRWRRRRKLKTTN